MYKFLLNKRNVIFPNEGPEKISVGGNIQLSCQIKKIERKYAG